MNRTVLGHVPDGRAVEAVTLTNANGLEARILTLGGILQAFHVPDREGQFANVVLGFPDVAGYLGDDACHGAIVGRYANRIAGGRFTLDGREYQLSRNEGENTLHGGAIGFHRALWRFVDGDFTRVILEHVSPDGDQGFPGELTIRVSYALHDDNVLRVSFEASTTNPTVINLTNHAYWNLRGEGTVLGHQLQVFSERFTPVDAQMIPTGELKAVAGTPFDFRNGSRLKDRVLDRSDPQVALAGGIDHNFALSNTDGGLTHAATLSDDASGRTLEVWTSEPGLQVYTGNNLSGVHARWSGIALETQHFPNAPNEPSFPSTALRPGQTLRSLTDFRLLSASDL